MKVARWGNSLAVRLPRGHVEALGLEEGDEVDIAPEAIRKVESAEERRRAQAVKRLEALSWSSPPGYTFRRDDIYENHRNGLRPDPEAVDDR